MAPRGTEAPDPKPDPAPVGHARREGDQSNRPLIALLVFICIAVAGWFLLRWMKESSRLQDCVMSGRRNCAPVESAPER